MLKLTLKPGEYINIGDNVKVVFSGGSANNIHLLVDAPREIAIVRSNANTNKDKDAKTFYKEKGISKEAQKEIANIIRREKQKG
ncbi:MAG: carbon storage regulator [Lachnospiraceae bacterium]|nr:carbon storage regulator [Lachnospiraceae bacterium]MEE1516016.1 carbon storage regulator [Lachnospiraceae bacterium]